MPWPIISEEVQERCLTRISGRVRFIEGLSPRLQSQATSDAVGDHPEPEPLAYVFGKFKQSGLLSCSSALQSSTPQRTAPSCRRYVVGLPGVNALVPLD